METKNTEMMRSVCVAHRYTRRIRASAFSRNRADVRHIIAGLDIKSRSGCWYHHPFLHDLKFDAVTRKYSLRRAIEDITLPIEPEKEKNNEP